MNRYYILISNHSVFVKEEQFFIDQGGLVDDWGKNWIPVDAVSIEHARSIGENIRDDVEKESWSPSPIHQREIFNNIGEKPQHHQREMHIGKKYPE